jgi:hypothetical protein
MTMGLIEKSIRKRSNQKLAAEVFTQTALSFDEVVVGVRKYCTAENEKVSRLLEESREKAKTRLGKWTASLADPKNSHYYVSPHPEMRHILIGFGQRPEPILAGRGNTLSGVWAARLSYPAHGSTVGLVLLKWAIGGNDGVLKNKGFYEALLDNVHTIISDGSADHSGTEGDPGTETIPASTARSAPLIDEVTQPRRVQAGDWAAALGTRFPFLERIDMFGLAGLRALLAVNPGYYSSTYITEGKHSTSQIYESSTHSLLRCRWASPSGITMLDCGAPRPDLAFAADWQLRYMVSEYGEAVIEVPYHRMTNNNFRSGELMVRLREAVTETLATGIQLELDDGPPSTEGLVVNMPADTARHPDNDQSPFGQDRLGGVSGVYREPLALSVSARDAVLAAIDASHFRSAPGDGDVLRVASLAGGRPLDAGSVALRRGAESDQLAIDIPATLEPTERDRSYRAAMRFLSFLARHLEESAPDSSAAVRAHMERIGADNKNAWMTAAGTRLKDRPPGLWLSNWDRRTAVPMVPIAVGRRYPVGVRVTTATATSYLLQANAAADWVNAFKQARPVLRPDGRPSGRQGFTARRCGPLYSENNRQISCLRYVPDQDIGDYSLTRVATEKSWFWEVNPRGASATEPSGSNGGTLLVTGWSQADGVLGYGQDLLAMLQAFTEVVSVTDDKARIQTLYLVT